MNRINFITTLLLLYCIMGLNAQVTDRQRPAGWDSLVYGGRFMDRFQPLPDLGGMSAETWGAPGVNPRDTNNGIEHKDWSYWGGNIRLLDDGKYHLFVCRWAENSPNGHFEWGNSDVVHAVSENSFGPFKVVQEIGKGHNPEWYITKEGKYVIYVINGYYVSDDIYGPWEYNKFEFDLRDRKIIDDLSNLTFAKREDGSFLMICRGGGVWISEDGISSWNQLTDKRVYPPVDGRFEDPLVWKTNVQYHLIVNDWFGRIAWYMRSKDGIHWKVDAGEAYLPGIARHADGTVEDWFKFERIKMLQDSFGRATQANFAVIDTFKYMDLSDDNHSSKFLTIPLTVGKLLTVLNDKPISDQTSEIRILIEAEDNFDPNTDMDIGSLRFGAPELVDFGKGCKVKTIQKDGKNAIVTFYGEGNGITADNFAGKLLGKDSNGNLLFGYSRLPGVKYIEPALSARSPLFDSLERKISIVIENFGQVASMEATVHVFHLTENKKTELAHGLIPPIDPYKGVTITLVAEHGISGMVDSDILVLINKGKQDEVSFLIK
jgi:hypothetical protein